MYECMKLPFVFSLFIRSQVWICLLRRECGRSAHHRGLLKSICLNRRHSVSPRHVFTCPVVTCPVVTSAPAATDELKGPSTQTGPCHPEGEEPSYVTPPNPLPPVSNTYAGLLPPHLDTPPNTSCCVCVHHTRLAATSSARPSSSCPSHRRSAVSVLQLLLTGGQHRHTASSAHLQRRKPLQSGNTHTRMHGTKSAQHHMNWSAYLVCQVLSPPPLHFSPSSSPLRSRTPTPTRRVILEFHRFQ